MKLLTKIILFAAVLLIIFSCNNAKEKHNQIIIFHAGSLSVPFKQMKEAFEKDHPNIEILLEASGSVRCARKIIDLKKPCDIMASADYTVIDELLIPDYTPWNIKFASNEMCIVYQEESRYASEINAQNWHEILLKNDVAYGRSDPNSDPCGYRAVLTLKLAEDFFKKKHLADSVISKDNKFIRPKETDLLALLESKTIDYIFLYRSVAQQHGLKYIILPDSINLKNPDLKDYYKTASVEIVGKKPGETITIYGEPMVYGITRLESAPNRRLATDFLEFALSEKGQKIMKENGQPSLIPTISETYDGIPRRLKKYAKKP